MTFRERMNALADRVRRTPERLDERPTTVTIRTVTYAGGRRGADGPSTASDLVLSPSPRVRWVSGREIAASAGRYFVGDVKVGPITPAYPGGGGYTEAQLAPVVTVGGVEIVYVLEGIFVGEFARVALNHETNHGWELVLRQRRTTP